MQYMTPIAGKSVGMAVTLGRLVGMYIAKLSSLKKERKRSCYRRSGGEYPAGPEIDKMTEMNPVGIPHCPGRADFYEKKVLCLPAMTSVCFEKPTYRRIIRMTQRLRIRIVFS